jgi:hypothetical protein
MSNVAQDVQASPVSRTALWFGLLGGAIAWTLHLMLAYAAAEFGLVGRLGDGPFLGISIVAWLELAITAAAALAGAAATAVAYRNDRRLRSGAAEDDTMRASLRYTARAGLLTSGLFTFIILFESIPIFYYLRAS